MPLAQVSLSLGGFNSDQWQFSWTSGSDTWALFLQDRAMQERILEAPPRALASQVAGLGVSRRSRRIGTTVTVAVLALLVAGPALLLGLFWWQSERIVGAIADRVPLEAEQQLGQLVFQSTRQKLKLIENPQVTGTVREIGERLTRGSAYHYQWFVANDPAINAFAIPGGYVVVNSGLLLAADSAEELAGVLAHEVQHVERRHSLKGMIHGLGLAALVGFALHDYSGTIVATLSNRLGALHFGRGEESEADVRGLDALRRAGIDPRGMLVFFRKLAAKGEVNVPLLSTHPASEERARILSEMLRKSVTSQAQPLPYDWHAIKAALR